MKLWVYYLTALLAVILAWVFEVRCDDTLSALLCVIISAICGVGADIINAIQEKNND